MTLANQNYLALSKLYDIVSIPGKGLGLIASVSIPPGTHILNEAPLVAVPVPELHESGYALQAMLHSLQTGFASLTPAEKESFLSLHDHRFPGDAEANTDKLLSIFRSNAYNTGASHVGLFPKIARINHSCRPNCGNYWDEKSNLRVIYAARDIAPGEEITVSYIPLLKSTKERQARLVQYGFTCDCSACESVESSKRRERISDLFDVLDQRVAAKSTVVKSVQISIDKASKLISMLEEQQLHDYYARAYHLAAIFNERKGDLESAKKWALKELAIYELSNADSPEALEANEMIDNLSMEIMASLLTNSQNEVLKPRKLD
jgi:hypothetical protein